MNRLSAVSFPLSGNGQCTSPAQTEFNAHVRELVAKYQGPMLAPAISDREPMVPARPLVDIHGNNIVVRPLNLFDEIEKFLREDRERRECARLGLPYIGGETAGSWTLPTAAKTSLLNGTFDIDTDTYKLALFLSTSNIGASSTTYAGVTNEHANNNGYSTGGASITLGLTGTTTVTATASTVTFTASGGSIVARFAVVYEVSGNVLAYCLLDNTPADVTTTDGNSLAVASASGLFTLA